MISAGALWARERRAFAQRTMPRCAGLFLDSGGFTCLSLYGDYPWSRDEYLALIRQMRPDLVATLDYPCEPDIRRGDRFQTNDERIEATLSNAAWLLEQELPQGPTVVPVIQGYTADEYRSCVEAMGRRGLTRDYMAVGSMCRRWDPRDLRDTMTAIAQAVEEIHPGARLHWFGLKITALSDPACFRHIYSLDTAAWSMNGESRYPTGEVSARERFFEYRAKVYRLKARMVTNQVLARTSAVARPMVTVPGHDAATAVTSVATDHRDAPAVSVTMAALAEGAPAAVASLLARRRAILEEVTHLEGQGMTDAQPHWREGRYLYLIHPTQADGSRRREYVGNDPARGGPALALVERRRRHRELQQDRASPDRPSGQAMESLRDFYVALDHVPPW